MSDNVWIGVDYRSSEYDRIEDADHLESYKGKWAICCVLDDGSCVYSNPENWKDTKLEKEIDIEDCKEITHRDNLNGQYTVYNNTFACMFNSEYYKQIARGEGYPVCISMFPVPVK